MKGLKKERMDGTCKEEKKDGGRKGRRKGKAAEDKQMEGKE